MLYYFKEKSSFKASDIQKAIQQAIIEHFPNFMLHPVLLENYSYENLFYINKETGEPVWVRIFYQLVTYADVDYLVETELAQIHKKLYPAHNDENDVAILVFCPHLARGIQSSLFEKEMNWRWFEYDLLCHPSHQALALKEYQKEEPEFPSIEEEKPVKEKLKSLVSSPACPYPPASLSRAELSDLLDLSLLLKSFPIR